MQNNKNIIIAGIVLLVVIVGGIYLYKVNVEPKSNVTFPSGGETLVMGETYTVKWDNPGFTGAPVGSTTQIFLIDQSLLSQGALASISDRKYDVPDIGSYEYTVPTALQDSTYFFVIGTTTSKTFKITSSK